MIFAGFLHISQKVFNMKAWNLVCGVIEDSFICMLNFSPLCKFFGLLLTPQNFKISIFAAFRLLFQKVFDMKAWNLFCGVIEDIFIYIVNISPLCKFYGLLLAPRNFKICVFAAFRLIFQKVFNMKAWNLVCRVIEDSFICM